MKKNPTQGAITPRSSKEFFRRTKHNHTKMFRLVLARGWLLYAFHCRQIQKLAIAIRAQAPNETFWCDCVWFVERILSKILVMV